MIYHNIACVILTIVLSVAAKSATGSNISYINEESCPNSEKSDSVTELQELVVKSENRWFEGDKLICLPTKKEKLLSNSPASLISKMMIPGLHVQDDIVTNANGRKIVYFINGIRANETDITVFRTKDVLRVEYLPNPDDPKFEGAKDVVNFIVHEYAAGGVSKINGQQYIPNHGSYDIASKLVYKSMSYSVMANTFYSTDRLSRLSSGYEEYRDFYYKNAFYESAIRNYEESKQKKLNTTNIAANARYINNKMAITHTIAAKWTSKPQNNYYYHDDWHPSFFESSTSRTWDTSKNFSPEIRGTYQFFFNSKWGLGAVLRYAYSHTSQCIGFLTDGSPAIENDISEDGNLFGWRVQSSFIPSKKWSFTIDCSGDYSRYDTYYGGATDQRSGTDVLNSDMFFTIGWKPNDYLNLYLQPGLHIYRKSVNSSGTSITPDYQFSLNWNPERRFSFGLLHYMQNINPWISYMSDTIIQTAPLMWTSGNPSLKNFYLINTNLNAVWIISQFFDVTGSVMHNLENRSITHSYIPADYDMGGLIDSGINGNPLNTIRLSFSLNARLLSDRLSISATPVYQFQKSSGIYKKTLNDFEIDAQLRYTIGNVQLEAYYRSPTRYLDEAGAQVSRRDDSYGFGVTYGIGDLYLSVIGYDFFRKSRHSSAEYTSPYYSFRTDSYSRGRTLGISLSYTFGYGKQISRSISIQQSSGIGSAVVGSRK